MVRVTEVKSGARVREYCSWAARLEPAAEKKNQVKMAAGKNALEK
jgi:hypothetical protein